MRARSRITATAGDRSGTATLQVTDPPPPEPVVAVVTVSPSSASVEVGGMQLFQAAATTDDGTAVPDVEFTWTSSDEVVARSVRLDWPQVSMRARSRSLQPRGIGRARRPCRLLIHLHQSRCSCRNGETILGFR